MLVANLDYSRLPRPYRLRKILGGKVKVGDPAVCIHGDGTKTKGKITAIFHFEGMKRIEIQEAHAGDIVGLTGFEDVFIGETITRFRRPRSRCPSCPIDPPTIQMEFAVNDGPLAGQDGKLVTARHIWDRLIKEIRTNVALARRADRATRKFSRSADVAKCRSPFSSSRCAAKATKFWFRARKCFIARTPTAICSNRSKNCSSKFPRTTMGDDHGKSCRPQSARSRT